MKKILIPTLVIVLINLVGCTANEMAKNYGGSMTIKLDAGQKLVNATWKENELWYLTTPMDSAHVPVTSIFHEKSSFSIHEGSVFFEETK